MRSELSGLSPSTTYNARVLSRDGAGNLAASPNVAFNTDTATGLVAAYAFNEGAGATAADASGLNNTATITSAGWAAGKNGSAVALNGSSSVVSILDTNNSLDVSRLTAEAWLFKTGTGVGATIIMGRQTGSSFGDLWVLFYDNVGGADFYKFCALACVTGPSATPDINTWVHLAATEDGTTTRLYRNSVLVASSTTHSGLLRAETTRVCIGAGANDSSGVCNSEFIAARVDDARLYGVARTATQIQADMNTPVGSSADAIAPTVSITAPADGATVQGTVTVSATASDNVGVAGVQFKVDGANLGAEDTTAPYAVSWNTTTATNASHALTAVARDAAGNTTTSTTVTVTVNNTDGTPPTVSITAPANGATVQGSVTVSATASDNVGVAGVQFKVDGANLGAEDTTAPYAVSWNTTTATNATMRSPPLPAMPPVTPRRLRALRSQ
jgi:hypothetical protein